MRSRVINLLKFRGALAGWTVQPIDKMSPPQVAEMMRQSAFFLSFGHPEGFPIPPLEAMACGCVVVGYHGRGGREYFRPEFSYPMRWETSSALHRPWRTPGEFDQSPERLEATGRRAAEFIGGYCALEQEASRVAEIWTELKEMMRRRTSTTSATLWSTISASFRGFPSRRSKRTSTATANWRGRNGGRSGGGRVRRQGRAVLRPLAKLHLRSAQFDYRKEAVVEKLNGMHPKILQSIKTHAGHRFLEFGGGVGVMCQLAHEWGKEVTYVDLPGLVADFAAWRFQRHGWPIRLLLTEPRGLCLEEQYDIIFSDAVLEHVVDPDQVARELSLGTLLPHGLLVLLVDLGGPSDDWPMHRSIDIVHVHELIEAHGFRNTLGRHILRFGLG